MKYVKDTKNLIASMGPQLVRCGMKNVPGLILETPARLQWGRNLFVAECMPCLLSAQSVMRASMGPQLVRCGMQQRQLRRRRPVPAGFNGAATCSLRNVSLHALRRRMGHASMGPQLVRCGMYAVCFWHFRGINSFNGAATCSLRNEARAAASNAAFHASMGPQLVRCGMRRTALPTCQDGRTLQWGRNLFVAE